eukprot:6214497-Pleurochrysis_carterae.AAC.4
MAGPLDAAHFLQTCEDKLGGGHADQYEGAMSRTPAVWRNCDADAVGRPSAFWTDLQPRIRISFSKKVQHEKPKPLSAQATSVDLVSCCELGP